MKAGVPASGTEGQEGYVPAVPAVIAKAAYAHNGTDWEACDGNVDASKVILTQDYRLAGDYDKVGNIKKSDGTVSSNGKSVAQLFQEIFLKRLQPGAATQPSVTLKINNSNSNYSVEKEVGETATIPNYSATFNAGSYPYGPATGITATWNVTETKGNTSSTSASGSLPSVVAADSSQTYTVTATATHTAGATPTDNLGDPATSISAIASGTKSASHTVTVTGYRKCFWIYFNNTNMIDLENAALDGSDQIPGLLDGDNQPVCFDSDYIRTNGHGQKANFTSINLDGVEFQQILIFLPKNNTNLNKKLAADTKNGLPYINAPGNNCVGGTSDPTTITIAGAGSDAGVEYCIWEIKAGSPVNGDIVALTWA